MALLSRYLAPGLIRTLRSRAKDGAIRELAAVLAGSVEGLDAQAVTRAIQERERIVSSWIAPGIAVPHARLADWDGIALVVGRSRKGITWDSSDGNPVNLLFVIVSGENDPDRHVMLLAEIARTLRDRALTQLIITARTAEETYRLIISHGHVEEAGKPASSAKVRLSRLLFAHALSVAEEVKARAVLLHGDAVGNLHFIEDIPSDIQLILVTSTKTEFVLDNVAVAHVLQVPFPTLDRSDQVELALLFAVSRGLLVRGDTVVSLSGVPNSGALDTLLVIDLGREFPTMLAKATDTPLGDVEPQVLEKVLQLATDISREGREGRPVGTAFVVGDYPRVLKLCPADGDQSLPRLPGGGEEHPRPQPGGDNQGVLHHRRGFHHPRRRGDHVRGDLPPSREERRESPLGSRGAARRGRGPHRLHDEPCRGGLSVHGERIPLQGRRPRDEHGEAGTSASPGCACN